MEVNPHNSALLFVEVKLIQWWFYNCDCTTKHVLSRGAIFPYHNANGVSLITTIKSNGREGPWDSHAQISHYVRLQLATFYYSDFY